MEFVLSDVCQKNKKPNKQRVNRRPQALFFFFFGKSERFTFNRFASCTESFTSFCMPSVWKIVMEACFCLFVQTKKTFFLVAVAAVVGMARQARRCGRGASAGRGRCGCGAAGAVVFCVP